jgi:carbon storage regulator CsrA
MQIFQRGVNESLKIGRDMVVTVLEIQPSWVRLGIEDPTSDPAYWEETLFIDEDGGDAESYDSAEYACVAF